VNFTREPIIETIITPKDGYKLIIRSSKGAGQEEYSVDAVEVVSFGRSFFFRSMERPKPFLVPVSDYEVIETKEMRVALKNAPPERNIKIGGGREAAPPRHREHPPEKQQQPVASDEDSSDEEGSDEEGSQSPQRMDNKKRDRRRNRRRRGGPEPRPQSQDSDSPASQEAGEGGDARGEAPVSSSMFNALIPPPTKLISETMDRYKDFAISEGNLSSKPVKEEHPKEDKKKTPESPDDFSPSDVQNLSRMATPHDSFSITSFSSTRDTFFMS
jgi:hypothetical protein